MIYFNTDEYFLDKEDRSRISAAAQEIKGASANVVYIEGNTDEKKGVDNVWLSRARAEAVSKFLHNLVAKTTLNRMWYADKRPVALGITREDLALNRRVEIFIPVTVEKLVATSSPTSKEKVSKSFSPIAFNRNDFYLDAYDRSKLKTIAGQVAALGCLQISLVGTRDGSKGATNQTIAFDRVKAVRKYLHDIYPALRFVSEKVEISSEREVRISCTN